jgi:CopG family nickel-responsive transcriptional regulator
MNKKKITRTRISLEPELLDEFDDWIAKKGFPNRSEGLRFLIRDRLEKESLEEDTKRTVVGAFTYIFEHHSFDSGLRLIEIQHDYEQLIISNMHAHLTHEVCLETIFLKGEQVKVKELSEGILALKGVLNGDLALFPLNKTE